MAKAICSVPDCGKTAVGRGWCPAHWYRWSQHGDPLGGSYSKNFRAVDHSDGTRTCSKCGERKPLDDFHKVKDATLGRRSDCKTCRSASMRKWHAGNIDERLERARIYRAENGDAIRERDRKRNKTETRREQHARRVAVRRLRMSGAPCDPGVTRNNLRKQYGDLCFYCAAAMTFERIPKGSAVPPNLATVDHYFPIALGGGHTWDNAVLACWTCNASKRHKPADEWLATRN